MPKSRAKPCITVDCRSRPSYNYRGLKKPIHCAPHGKLLGMVNVVTRQCEWIGENGEECYKVNPSFNHPGESKGKLCASHMEDGMVDVTHQRCQWEGEQGETCDIKNPSFNFPDEKNGTHCKSHKIEGMEDITHKKCKGVGCKSRPSHNFPDAEGTLYCAVCAKPGMENIITQRCAYPGCCKLNPSYNMPTETKGLYCVYHASDEMVNVTNTCCVENCHTRPTFNFPDKTVASCCRIHKKPGMVDVINQKCSHTGCSLHPNFGYPGENPIVCKTHSTSQMINLRKITCQVENCNTTACYGICCGEITHCAVHADLNTMIFRPKKHCNLCSEYGIYIHNGIRYCSRHNITKSRSLEIHECSTCKKSCILYEGKCLKCDPITAKRYLYDRSSKEAREWIAFKQSGLKIQLQTADSDEGEYRPFPGSTLSFDAYEPDAYKLIKGTDYEFNGSLYHGDPAVYPADTISSITGRKMGDIYKEHLARTQKVLDAGYNVVEMWSAKWKWFKKFMRNFQVRWRQNQRFKLPKV